MSPVKLIASLSAVLLCSAPALLGQTYIVNDPLDNTDRSTQALPGEAAWFKGGGTNVVLNPTTDGMIFTRSDAGTSRLLATNFTSTTLTVGQTLVMDYTFSASSIASGNAFNTDNRLGLFNFNGTGQMTADNSSANGPSFTGVGGYTVYFHLSTALAATPFTINKMSASPTNMSSSGSFTALSGPTTLVTPSGGLSSNAEYTLRMELSYVSASQMDITVSFRDSTNAVLAAVTASDTSNITTTFDSFLYRAGTHNNFGQTQTITHFAVSTIPEPSTYAALLGAAALGLVAYRRRRATKL
jgi:hypothetical protein